MLRRSSPGTPSPSDPPGWPVRRWPRAMSVKSFRAPTGVFVLLCSFALLAACSSTPEPVATKKEFARETDGIGLERVTDLSTLPNLRVLWDHRAEALQALAESRDFFGKPSSQNWFPHPTSDREITHEDQVRTLERLENLLLQSESAQELEGRLLNEFDFYRSVGWNGHGEVLFTAYCTPIFDGRLQQEGPFRYPLYRQPESLVKQDDGKPLGRRDENGEIVASWTRTEIEETNPFAGTEIVWLRDPFEVYVAHVQGSVRIRFEDGSESTFGYAGKTEHEYVSIRQVLVDEGRLDRDTADLAAIERYFQANPGDMKRVLRKNPSYVFFTEYGDAGPFGSIGSKVTGYHTIATDKSVFPRGGPALVDARLPLPDNADVDGWSWRRQALLTFDQDTGGAIRAAGRADVFLGVGDEAKRRAGMVKSEGRLFYFFIKP